MSREDVTLINREEGAGARHLLDQRLEKEGLHDRDVRGYNRIAESHFQVARLIAEGQADVGVGVRSASNLLGLDFIPLQQSRYDLIEVGNTHILGLGKAELGPDVFVCIRAEDMVTRSALNELKLSAGVPVVAAIKAGAIHVAPHCFK